MEITWNGDWFYALKSHAFVDRNIVVGLHKLGHRVRVTHIVDLKFFDKSNEDHKLIDSMTKDKFESDYNVYKFPTILQARGSAEYNALLHGDGAHTLSHRERGIISSSNISHLWLPTPEQAKIVDEQLDIPVVSPGVDGGFDPLMFHPKVEPFNYSTLGIDKDTFVFILACDGAQRTPQKPYGGFRGSDIALEAFIKEFSPKEKVCLVIKAARDVGIVDSFIDKMRSKVPNLPKIVRDYGQEPHALMARKWKAADCMLNPIRDCRWEMCCLEALAVGTPCIATNCGGPKRYGKKGVFFVSYNTIDGDLVTSRGDVPISRDYWTEPKLDEFRNKMREVYESKGKLKEIGLEGSEHVMKHWRWIDMSQRVVDFFEGKAPTV